MASQTEAVRTELTDEAPVDPAALRPNRLRIRVVDTGDDGHRSTVNIKIPIRVVKFGMKMAQAFSPDMRNADLDWDSITEMIDEQALGKIIEVDDEAAHKTIEVWVE